VLDADEVRVEVNRIESLRIDYQRKAEIAMLALKEAAGFEPEKNCGSRDLSNRPRSLSTRLSF